MSAQPSPTDALIETIRTALPTPQRPSRKPAVQLRQEPSVSSSERTLAWFRPPNHRCLSAEGSTAKYALSSISKCGKCGGSIGVVNTRLARGRVKAYACMTHHRRGGAVCLIKTSQPIDEIDAAVADYVEHHLLQPESLELILESVREQLDEELNRATSDVGKLDSEISDKRSAIKRLIRLGSMAGDDSMSEIASELRRFTEQVRQLEAERSAVLRTPNETVEMMVAIERGAKKALNDLRKTLRKDPAGAREVYRQIFASGLTFNSTARSGKPRKVWRIEGIAKLPRSTLRGDPTGT